MAATTFSPGIVKPKLIRDTSQTTDCMSFYTDRDSSGTPSVGSSPSPPPSAGNIAFPTTNDGFPADPSPSASMDEGLLHVAQPRRLDPSRTRLPVFMSLGKGERAPPLNHRPRSTSTEGEYGSSFIARVKQQLLDIAQINAGGWYLVQTGPDIWRDQYRRIYPRSS